MTKYGFLLIDVQEIDRSENGFSNIIPGHCKPNIPHYKQMLGFANKFGMPVFVAEFVKEMWGPTISPLEPYLSCAKKFKKYGLDAFDTTTLRDILDDDGVSTLVIGGYDLKVCLPPSVSTAMGFGYDVVTSPELLSTYQGDVSERMARYHLGCRVRGSVNKIIEEVVNVN